MLRVPVDNSASNRVAHINFVIQTYCRGMVTWTPT